MCSHAVTWTNIGISAVLISILCSLELLLPTLLILTHANTCSLRSMVPPDLGVTSQIHRVGPIGLTTCLPSPRSAIDPSVPGPSNRAETWSLTRTETDASLFPKKCDWVWIGGDEPTTANTISPARPSRIVGGGG